VITAQPQHRLGNCAQGVVESLVPATAGLDPAPDLAKLSQDGGVLILAVQLLELAPDRGELAADRFDLAADIASAALPAAGFVVSKHGIASG
jgi:hypothetical protein